jgi:predicted transcriptional regulator
LATPHYEEMSHQVSQRLDVLADALGYAPSHMATPQITARRRLGAFVVREEIDEGDDRKESDEDDRDEPDYEREDDDQDRERL